ncbi:MAG: TRAP transporter large permease [Deltaproteobacteria bacterium]|nr:TRAP transporter large permease [Deltaproteobacteria bacterium]
MFTVGILLTIFCWVVGFPIWAAFGLGGIFLMVVWQGQPLLVYPHIFFQGMDSYSLLALPFFILSGQMMITGGAAKAIFRWIESFVGHFTGGLAVAAVIACMLFGTISGSTIATMAAISSICIPMMMEKKYDKNTSLGLLAASGSLGQLIPPSIIVIVFASLTGAPIDILFFAGFFPGFVLTAMLCIASVFAFRRKGGVVALPRVSWAERGRATVYALPALIIPLTILGGIYSGIMTPVEAAAVSIFICIPVSIILCRGTSNVDQYGAKDEYESNHVADGSDPHSDPPGYHDGTYAYVTSGRPAYRQTGLCVRHSLDHFQLSPSSI